MKENNKTTALHYISVVAGHGKLYIVILLLVLVNILLFALLVVWQIALRALLRFLEEYSKSTYENAFKKRLFRELLMRDYGEVTAVHSGEWMNRLTSDTVLVAEGFKSGKKKSLSVEEVKDYNENHFEALCINHVDFSCDEDNEVLRDYSMSVHKGEFVAFTGASGCGKSTVLKLLLGL